MQTARCAGHLAEDLTVHKPTLSSQPSTYHYPTYKRTRHHCGPPRPTNPPAVRFRDTRPLLGRLPTFAARPTCKATPGGKMCPGSTTLLLYLFQLFRSRDARETRRQANPGGKEQAPAQRGPGDGLRTVILPELPMKTFLRIPGGLGEQGI
jgi:hypothetical protein